MLNRRTPSITLAYICVVNGRNSPVLAQRFVDSYRQYPPGYKHDVVVICNGGPPGPWLAKIFKDTNFRIFPRTNDGWDIGGYIHLAKESKSECLMCLGESVYSHKAGWLRKVAEAWEEYGPGMYGVYSSFLVRPHLNTTAFACARECLAGYGRPVLTRDERYAFEHGPSAMWRQIAWSGKAAFLVTWSGVYDYPEWRSPDNILWRGDQTNCLLFCNHTQRYLLSPAATKKNWEAGADSIMPTASK